MNRRSSVLFVSVLALLPSLTPADGATAADRPPNIVFFLVDDLGWKDLGCYGSSLHDTPHLDRLAASAMRFTDAYASCPVCSPTRGSVMTGKYPARLGITDWIPGQRPKNRPLECPAILNELPLEEVTIAEALKAARYETFFAGKWHLGGEGFWPDQQGFDVNKGGHHRGSPPGGYYSPYNNPALADGPQGEYLTDRLADESICFLEQHRDQPFLLYLSFYTVHTPIQACKRHIAEYQEKVDALPALDGSGQRPEGDGFTKLRQDNPAYASMVRAMDDNVGRVLETLDALELADDTVVIFTSDNGGRSTLFRSGNPTSNEPIRAGKGWCYEGGIRVPLIIRAPGVTRAGSLCDAPVTSTDFYPTILELAGLEPKPDQHRDGTSLVPLLAGGDSLPRQAVYWHYPHYHGSAWKPGGAMRAGPWKLIEFYEDQRVELYNLADDIREQKDLSTAMPDKTAQLLGDFHAWRNRIGAKMPTPNPNYSAN
jgi:arylsulfatase A-like enzyme